MRPYRPCPLPPPELARVAAAAGCSERTVRRYLLGEAVSAPVERLLSSVLALLGHAALVRRGAA